MRRGIAKLNVFFPNEAFLIAKSALGPHGANPPHIHMHTGKVGQILQIRIFYATQVESGVDGPRKTTGHP